MNRGLMRSAGLAIALTSKGTDGSRVTARVKSQPSTKGRGEPVVEFEVNGLHCGS